MEKQEQSRQVIHLYVRETDKHFYFGSLSALYENFNREDLGVAIQTLYNQFKGDSYDNDKVVIRKGRLVQKKHQKENDKVDE